MLIGELLLGRLLNSALQPLDPCQPKISGEKSKRLLADKFCSPYRPIALT
jgi:hypothetical protein